MQIIHFYLVSILLLYYIKSSIAPGVISMVNPINTAINPTINNKSFLPSNRSNALSVPSISATRTSKNYQTLHNNSSSTTKIMAINKSDKNKADLNNLTDTFYDNPDDTKNNSVASDLYNATANVFRFLLDMWFSNSENLQESVEKIGIPDDIVLLVNGAMTQLFEFQRNNKNINIDNLSDLFYYMFDIKHMLTNDTIETNEKILKDLSSKIQYHDFQNVIGGVINQGLCTLVDKLHAMVDELEKKSKYLPYIMVNTALMKGLMLLKISDQENFNKMISALPPNYLIEVVDTQYEIKRAAIEQNHVHLIKNIMPIIFGILYTHMKLLNELNKHDKDVEENERIYSLNKLCTQIMNTFINRYFIFGNKDKTTELQSIQELMEKFDPLNPESPHISKLTETAIYEVLGLVGNTEAEDWKKNYPFKIDYQENRDKKYYMDFLNDNAELLRWLLKSFDERLLISIELITNTKYVS